MNEKQQAAVSRAIENAKDSLNQLSQIRELTLRRLAEVEANIAEQEQLVADLQAGGTE